MPVPCVSVIIPVFNRARTLRRAIDSVLSQDLTDFELIIIDDGSTDGSAELARNYVDPRIRVIELEAHGGSNAARNAGVRSAKSPIVAFLDSDDAYLPHKLSTVVEEFERRPDLDVLVDSFVKMSPDGPRARQNARISTTEEFRRRIFSRELWKSTSAITVRREIAVKGLFDEGVSRRQDMDFLIKLSEFANCAATDATLWVKHWSEDGISSNRSFLDTTLELVGRHPQYLGDSAYRIGLSRDLTRHILLLMRKHRLREAWQAVASIASRLGWRSTAALLVSGANEFARRTIKRRRGFRAANRTKAQAAVRSRASMRS
jgi:glycosyltransferase involved in cell wall biosynthesis